MQGFLDVPPDETPPTAHRRDQAGLVGSRDVAAVSARVGRPVAEPAPATLTLYAGDWAHFSAWCRSQVACPLPASPDTVGAYLLALAPTLSRGALGRRRAAINAMHRQAGLPPPTLDAAARKAVRTAVKGQSFQGPAPLSPATLVRLATRCPRDLAGLRDRALLLLVAATTRKARSSSREPRPNAGPSDESPVNDTGAVPRLFLLALDAEDIRFAAGGAVLQLRSRSGEPEPSRSLMLNRDQAAHACPVRALEDWLRASDTAYGPVFRKVDRWGNVEHGRLGPDAWHRILARRTGRPPRSALAAPA